MCLAVKHAVGWCYRLRADHPRAVTSTWCSSCTRASVVLACGRNGVLREGAWRAEAMPKRSPQIAARLLFVRDLLETELCHEIATRAQVAVPGAAPLRGLLTVAQREYLASTDAQVLELWNAQTPAEEQHYVGQVSAAQGMGRPGARTESDAALAAYRAGAEAVAAKALASFTRAAQEPEEQGTPRGISFQKSSSPINTPNQYGSSLSSSPQPST